MDRSPTAFRRINLVHAPSWVPRAFVLEVDAQQTALSDFARHGVHCPPAVERSVPRRRAEYLAGRRAAQAALLEHGVAACDIGTGGDRAPAWPEGYTGSITHSVRMAAAVWERRLSSFKIRNPSSPLALLSLMLKTRPRVTSTIPVPSWMPALNKVSLLQFLGFRSYGDCSFQSIQK